MRPLAFLLALLFAATARTDAAPPNVLFLFSDDQRADTIHALGNDHIATPNLDALVASGTTFTRAYCMGAMQGAVCVPSRAMLMSSRTLFHVKENLQGTEMWPEKFAAAGYTTFMSGKWHNGPESVQRAFPNARAVFLGGMTQQKVEAAPVADIVDGKLTNKRPAGKIPSELFADNAVEFLRTQRGERPFLCYVAFNLPHDPRVVAPEFHERNRANPPPVPANFLPQHPFNNGEMVVRDERLAPWPRTPEVIRAQLADYYAATEFIDAQVGRILAALRESGQFDRTIIVFSSDHGLAMGSHGLLGKQNLYDHSMRAPLIFAGPGVPRGERREAFCYLLDIFPTLGALTHVAAPAGAEGISLAGTFADAKQTIRDSIFTAYTRVQRAVRDDRWKLIVYPRINKTQLFDLAADPAEMHDLAADPAHAGDIERMTKLLVASQQKCGDTLPLRSEKPDAATFDFTSVKESAKTE